MLTANYHLITNITKHCNNVIEKSVTLINTTFPTSHNIHYVLYGNNMSGVADKHWHHRKVNIDGYVGALISGILRLLTFRYHCQSVECPGITTTPQAR